MAGLTQASVLAMPGKARLVEFGRELPVALCLGVIYVQSKRWPPGGRGRRRTGRLDHRQGDGDELTPGT
jgi:hypothetical protein